jgi:hypothetical protein
MEIIYKDYKELTHHKDVRNETKYSIHIHPMAMIQSKQYSNKKIKHSFFSFSLFFTKGTDDCDDIELNRTKILLSF